MKNKNFTWLYLTNFWGVLNDNFLKTLACFITIRWVIPDMQGIVVSAAAGSLVLPYIFFSPLAANIANRYGRVRIIRICKWAEIPIMAIAIAGFATQSLTLTLLAVLLMGTQSSLFSPAKYGLIRCIGGKGKVSSGMGGMEAISFFGMLSGMVTASLLVDKANPQILYVLLMVFAVAGLCSSYLLRADETGEPLEYSSNPLRFLKSMHAKADSFEGLNPVIYTLSVFWWFAATLQMGLIIFCKNKLGIDSFSTGLILSLAAVGITCGCAAAGMIDKKRSLLGYAPAVILTTSVLCLIMYFADLGPEAFAITLFLTAFTSAFFKIPLDAEIQKNVDQSNLNSILAYFNQVSFIFILLASISYGIVSLSDNESSMFMMSAVVLLLSGFYILVSNRKIICSVFHSLLSLRYDIRISGREKLTENKTLLLMPNHAAVVDPMIIFTEFVDLRLRPLVDESYFNLNVSRRVLALFDAIKVPDLHKSRKGVEQIKQLDSITIANLKAGRNIIFYPSGHITKTGTEQIGSRHLAYETCKNLPDNVEACLVRISGLWGSMWSRKGKKKTPQLAAGIVKSIGLILSTWVFWAKKRVVHIEIVPMTAQLKEWASTLDKADFNKKLEEFYNGQTNG